MSDLIRTPIETPRLIIRRWRISDAPDMYEYAKHPDVGPAAGWKPHESLEESQNILRTMFLDQDQWALVDKETNKVIGSIGVMKDPSRRVEKAYEFGYVLAYEYWGQGLMLEATTEIVKYIFQQLNASVLAVGHYPFNMRSKSIIEKLGFKYEGTIRQGMTIYDGTTYDKIVYSMLREEYIKKYCQS